MGGGDSGPYRPDALRMDPLCTAFTFPPSSPKGLQPGLNLRTWVPEASMLTTRPLEAANVDGNITLGKLDYRRAVYICTQHLISHTFSTNLHFISCLKKLRKQSTLNIDTHFYNQDHI